MFGGVERILETLARSSTSGPIASSFALCFDGRFAGAVAARGAPVTLLGPVRASRPWQVRSAGKRLTQLLATDAPDLAVVHSAWSHTFQMMWRCGLPPLVPVNTTPMEVLPL